LIDYISLKFLMFKDLGLFKFDLVK